MKTFVFILSIILAFYVVYGYAQSDSKFMPDELKFLEHAKQKGATAEQLNQLRLMIKVKREGEKKWSEEELNELDRLLLTK